MTTIKIAFATKEPLEKRYPLLMIGNPMRLGSSTCEQNYARLVNNSELVDDQDGPQNES